MPPCSRKQSLVMLAALFVSPHNRLQLLSRALMVTPPDYSHARHVRIIDGHEAAMSLYQQLLHNNPNDVTAATRIAASSDSRIRQDATCVRLDSIQQLRKLLQDSHYDNVHIQKMMGIPEHMSYAAGPVYLTPAAAGTVTKPIQISPEANDCSLQCLVSLFLLGLSVHCNVLNACLVGGQDSVRLLQDLGLAFPCSLHPDLLVPHVHLFPFQVGIQVGNDNLVLATDLHPRVLSTTAIGTREDGTVMYIGPDSLALARNVPLPTSKKQESLKILDLCTGSGVQALTALRMLNDASSKALCVDINERALRFVKFNAALNELEDQIQVQQADLVAGTINCDMEDSLLNRLRSISLKMNSRSQTFDVILANPPFIPVPPDNDVILQRYGLFSSGGTNGEDVLQVVVQLAAESLTPNGGLLAIVSEFMNPPSLQGDYNLLERILEWWSNGPGGRGVLLTNEFPVDAEMYPQRRADSQDEVDIWSLHLSRLNVTHVSPGLLFMTTDPTFQKMELQHELVPKTSSGSIWTPSNRDAVEFIQKVLRA